MCWRSQSRKQREQSFALARGGWEVRAGIFGLNRLEQRKRGIFWLPIIERWMKASGKFCGSRMEFHAGGANSRPRLFRRKRISPPVRLIMKKAATSARK